MDILKVAGHSARDHNQTAWRDNVRLPINARLLVKGSRAAQQFPNYSGGVDRTIITPQFKLHRATCRIAIIRDPHRCSDHLTDAKNSVLAESGQDELRQAVYGAYGERRPEDDLQCLLGFNGEVRDELSGWYLLGRGYRVYNPSLMCFHSPDSLSPFDAGGINPYMYTAGDPINFTDPTGHANRGVNWLGVLGTALSVIGIALSIAAVAIAPPVGALAIGVTVTFTTVGVGTGLYGAYQGVAATTATRLKDREKHARDSVIAGAFDVAFGLFGLWRAVRSAARIAAATAAQKSWHAHLKTNFTHMGDIMGGINKMSPGGGVGATAASAASEGSGTTGLVLNRFKKPTSKQAIVVNPTRTSAVSPPNIPPADYPGSGPAPAPPSKPPKPSKSVPGINEAETGGGAVAEPGVAEGRGISGRGVFNTSVVTSNNYFSGKLTGTPAQSVAQLRSLWSGRNLIGKLTLPLG